MGDIMADARPAMHIFLGILRISGRASPQNGLLLGTTEPIPRVEPKAEAGAVLRKKAAFVTNRDGPGAAFQGG